MFHWLVTPIASTCVVGHIFMDAFISVNIDSDVPFYGSPLRFIMMGAWMGLPFLA